MITKSISFMLKLPFNAPVICAKSEAGEAIQWFEKNI